MTETPCVIVDVQRAGPSTGQATKAAQGDLMQARWGSHGDYESIVLAPYSAQETYELTFRAFDLSERLRHPVILLSDEVVAHSRERVVVKDLGKASVERRFAARGEPPFGGIDKMGRAIMPRFGDGHNLLVTGSTHDERGLRRTSDPEVHDKLVRRLVMKIVENKALLTDTVVSGPAEAEWGIVSFGCSSRTVEEVMMEKHDSLSLRSLRLRTIWPFPDAEVKRFATTVEKLLVPELNLGQLVREVSRAVGNSVEVFPLNKIRGGLMIEPEELVKAVAGT